MTVHTEEGSRILGVRNVEKYEKVKNEASLIAEGMEAIITRKSNVPDVAKQLGIPVTHLRGIYLNKGLEGVNKELFQDAKKILSRAEVFASPLEKLLMDVYGIQYLVIDDIETEQRILSWIYGIIRPNEKKAITIYYGLNGDEPQSLRATGEMMGFSGELARQLIFKVRRKMLIPKNLKKTAVLLNCKDEAKVEEQFSMIDDIDWLKQEINHLNQLLEEKEADKDYLLEELNLNNRAYNKLKRAGFNKVSDVTRFSYDELKSIQNIGTSTVNNLLYELSKHGINLKIEQQKGEKKNGS